MEPDHVKETSIHDLAVVAAGGDICNGPRGFDNHGQELLAERGQAKHTEQNWSLAKRGELCLRLRPGRVTLTTRDEREQWRMALPGRSEISLTPESRATHHSHGLWMDDETETLR